MNNENSSLRENKNERKLTETALIFIWQFTKFTLSWNLSNSYLYNVNNKNGQKTWNYLYFCASNHLQNYLSLPFALFMLTLHEHSMTSIILVQLSRDQNRIFHPSIYNIFRKFQGKNVNYTSIFPVGKQLRNIKTQWSSLML